MCGCCVSVTIPSVRAPCFEFVGGFLPLPRAGGEDVALNFALDKLFRARCEPHALWFVVWEALPPSSFLFLFLFLVLFSLSWYSPHVPTGVWKKSQRGITTNKVARSTPRRPNSHARATSHRRSSRHRSTPRLPLSAQLRTAPHVSPLQFRSPTSPSPAVAVVVMVTTRSSRRPCEELWETSCT